MLKSEERMRCDSSSLGSESAFVLRSLIYFAFASRIYMPSVTRRSVALRTPTAVDARFACATELSEVV